MTLEGKPAPNKKYDWPMEINVPLIIPYEEDLSRSKQRRKLKNSSTSNPTSYKNCWELKIVELPEGFKCWWVPFKAKTKAKAVFTPGNKFNLDLDELWRIHCSVPKDWEVASREDIMYLGMKAAGELGELLNIIGKEIIGVNRVENARDKMLEELGDTLAFLHLLASCFNMEFGEAIGSIMPKVRSRYLPLVRPEKTEEKAEEKNANS